MCADRSIGDEGVVAVVYRHNLVVELAACASEWRRRRSHDAFAAGELFRDQYRAVFDDCEGEDAVAELVWQLL